MNIISELDKRALKKNVPEIASGFTVRVHQKIKEGDKDRIQVFEGLVIKVSSGSDISKSFTVRKVVDSVGVEKIFPLHSPNVDRIEVVKKAKVRRSKLYYVRTAQGARTKFYEKKKDAAPLGTK